MHIFSLVLFSDKKRVEHVLNNHVKNLQKNNQYEIIPAIEGKTNELEYRLQDRRISENFLQYALRGQIACFLSHLKIYQILCEKNIREAIILEDDAYISEDFLHQIEKISPVIKKVDFLYLFIHPDSMKNMKSVSLNLQQKEEEGEWKEEKDEGKEEKDEGKEEKDEGKEEKDEGKEEKQIQFYKGKTYGTVGYYIKKELCEEILKLTSHEISMPIDEFLLRYLNSSKNYYCCNIVNTIGSLYATSHINPNSLELGSNIGQTKKYKDGFVEFTYKIEEEKYYYYPACGLVDGNMSYSHQLKDLETLEEYKKLFISDETIKGFSTDGWIKNRITNNWKLIKWNQGLFIKKDKPKVILLTGGGGFIGSNCAYQILKDSTIKEDLLIIDNFCNSHEKTISYLKYYACLFSKKIYFYDIDLAKENFSHIFENYHIMSVIHFAALKAVKESVEDPLKYYQNNLISLLNLLEEMEKSNVQKLIFSSSATVYGQPEKLPLTEVCRIGPCNPYGKTKYFSEEILKDISKTGKIKVINLRYFNPVGSTEIFFENPKGTPNNLFPYIVSVLKGEKEFLTVNGNDYNTRDGTGVRDYIHVEDLALGHIAALRFLNFQEGKEGKEGNFTTINLGTGKGYSVLEVIEKFKELSGKEIPIKFGERREGDCSEVYASCELAQKILNWTSCKNLDDMVRDSLKLL
jgi:UDP-glucose 4-epimerase